jgi:hypothetical protein
MNKFDEMRAAVSEARHTFSAADSVAASMADILRGRLRNNVPAHTLRALKKELRDFDMHRGRWKEDK